MNKKIVSLVATGLLLAASPSFAAKGAGQTGIFLGVEAGTSDVKYTFGADSATNAEVPFEIIAGYRFYVGKFGFGVKGLISSDTYSHTVNGTKVSGEGLRYGGEGQLYFDFKQFSIKSRKSSVGLALGAGYEMINYSSTMSNNSVAKIAYKNFSDESLYYTGALYFTVGANRLEVGYKKVDYSATTAKTNAAAALKPQKVGFNSGDTIFAAYSFTF